jgi:hypothetical protein
MSYTVPSDPNRPHLILVKSGSGTAAEPPPSPPPLATGPVASPGSPPPIVPASTNREICDRAVILSLTGVDLQTALELLENELKATADATKADFDSRREHAKAEHARLEQELKLFSDYDKTDADTQRRIAELTQRRAVVAYEIAQLDVEIERRRAALERQKLEEEVKTLGDEEKAAIDKLATEREEQYQEELTHWNASVSVRTQRVQELTKRRGALAAARDELIKRWGERRDVLMTPTIAGFLIWSGYTGIAATGAAVGRFLYPSNSGGSLIGTLLAASKNLVDSVGTRVPSWLIVPAVALIMLVLLASVAGVFYITDWLIRHFDGSWDAKKKKEDQSSVVPSRPSIVVDRRSYVRALGILPFVYAFGLLLAFLTMNPSAADPLVKFVELAPRVMGVFIGTVLPILTAAVFVIYLIRVMDPRFSQEQAQRRWWQGWEIAVLPVALIVPFVVGMAYPKEERTMWGTLSLFMILSSIALAYGMLLRGMFRQIAEAELAVDICDYQIDELTNTPARNDPDREEVTERRTIRRRYAGERVALLELSRENRLNRMLGKPAVFLWTLRRAGALLALVRMRKVMRLLDEQPEQRVTAEEAAPELSTTRSQTSTELVKIDAELATLASSEEQRWARAREAAEIRRQLGATNSTLATAESEQRKTLNQIERRHARDRADFVTAFHLAGSLKPAFEILNERNRLYVATATRFHKSPLAEVPK